MRVVTIASAPSPRPTRVGTPGELSRTSRDRHDEGAYWRRDIQGLRAIAVLSVVAYHYQLGPFHGGYVGVDVFFVISGFVITNMLSRAADSGSRPSLLDFYATRARRILPAASVTLLATVVATYVVLGGVRGLTVAGDARAALAFLANVHFSHVETNYLLAQGPSSPVLHFWSLSIEEQFYFVWPTVLVLIIARAGALGWRRVAIAVTATVAAASCVFGVVLTHTDPTAAYYSTWVRAGELAIGALVALATPSLPTSTRLVGRACSVLGLLLIAVAMVSFGASTAFPGTAVLVPVSGTALVIAGGGMHRGGRLEAVIGSPLMTQIGAISFSLYLWHWPIFEITLEKLGHVPSVPGRLVMVVAAVVLATLSYQCCENPVRRSSLLRRRRALTLGLAAMVLVATWLLVSVSWESVPGVTTSSAPRVVTSQADLTSFVERAAQQRRLGPLVVPVADVEADYPNDILRNCLVNYLAPGAVDGDQATNCFFGDTASSHTLVLYGDSNAAMWLRAFDELGRRHHVRVDLVARSGCEVAHTPLWDYSLRAPGVGCTDFRAWALQQIVRVHAYAVVVADFEYSVHRDYAFRALPENQYLAALAHTVHLLRATGASVTLLAPPPPGLPDPTTCLSTHVNDVGACSLPLSCLASATPTGAACQFPQGSALNWASTFHLRDTITTAGGHYVSLDDMFCTPSTCPAVINHVVVHENLFHVSDHFAAMTWPVLGEHLADVWNPTTTR